MSEACEWLHVQLEQLPVITFPFKLEHLPENGIYFFYEDGEAWGHGGCNPRIVRIGTHRDGNFRGRISEHFLFDESRITYGTNRSAPHDRSIFRKNIGRALLAKQQDDYLKVWETDFISRQNREKYSALRDIQKEKAIESEVTRILRKNFSFRFVIVDSQTERMGAAGLESSLIGTVAHCELCRPSSSWLGAFSPKNRIRESGLWLVQHLAAEEVDESDKQAVLQAIARTRQRIANGA